MARRGALSRALRWLLRWTAILVGAFVLLSVITVLALRWVHPPITSFMVQARVAALFEREPFELRHEWRPLTQIAPDAALAVVAAEDQRFPLHAGFDFTSIRKAMSTNAQGGRTRGASTISQQVAKNLFLWPGRSWARKGLEAWFTVLLEWLWPKQRILEVYLNVAEFGRGTYGVESASRLYFRQSARQVSSTEAALLAAVLPSPRRMHVERPSRYVLSRSREIQGQMRALGPAWLKDVR
jgi:monofunctional biosynthetic peptidoglycan transglycosylase